MKKMPELLKGCSAGVVPLHHSPAEIAAIPVKLLEYVSMKLPVVVSEWPNIKRYFSDKQVYFFEPDNQLSLEMAMLDLYSNANKRTIKANLAENFLNEHGWHIYRQKYLDLLENVINR